jgi:hypothetical protein
MSNWRILGGVAACLLTLTGLSASAAASTSAVGPRTAHPATNCAAIASPYGTAKPLLRACGYSIYPLRRVITNSDGSKTYVYNLNGTRVTSMVPPPHFNPFRASNAQLKRYGLPPRTALGHAQWRSLMSHLSVPAPPSTLIGYGKATNSFQCRTCWAGYQADRHSTYYEAITSYIEPQLKSSSCSSPKMEAIWAGLGDEKSSIGQDGTSYGEGNNHGSWFEVIGPSFDTHILFGKKAKVGDKITAYVTYPSGEGAYTFTVFDKSKVILQKNYQTSIYHGNFALFVVEDPANGQNSNPFLSNFGNVTFTNTRAALIGHLLRKLGSYHHAALKITDTSGHTMASAGSLKTGNKFTVSYHQCS